MAKRKLTKAKFEARATAKVEASAKASFQRKKIITEVIPPDVTRARASAWLDILSPITEWAGLKGDALRHQRLQLRIQQEESLLLVAQAIQKKLQGKSTVAAIPSKVLVPALEKASLENPNDDKMIDMWASLLTSASMGHNVEPRYVGIISELSTSQAKCLSMLAHHRAEELPAPYSCFRLARHDLVEKFVRSELDGIVRPCLELEEGEDGDAIWSQVKTGLNEWIKKFDCPGVYLAEFSFGDIEYNVKVGEGLPFEDKDLGILESLGLIKRTAIFLDYEVDIPIYGFAGYIYLTGLGVDFVSVCEPDFVQKMEERQEKMDEIRNRAKAH